MDTRVKRALQLIEKECAREGLRVEDMATAVHLSSSRFRYVFKHEMGLSPRAYLTTLRMQRAKDLIEGSFLSIKEVMHLVGFADPSDFNRRYKLSFGVTPMWARRPKENHPQPPSALTNK